MRKGPVAAPAGFLEEMDRELVGWSDPEARIRQALEGDELALYAQPIMALRGSLRFPLAEVLVRLREEEQAMLPPGEFFPVFEHYGMMPQLDRWVTQRVLERLVGLGPGEGRFSINLSRQTYADDAFAQFVAGELGRARVAPARLIFELDEADVLAEQDAAARCAGPLREVGCGILIDGFGRRAVSFAPLKALRATLVKVDGTIIRNLPGSEGARNKLGAIVRVADVIDLEVIGECVEEQPVLNLLRSSGADYAQGFGIRRPAPLDTIAPG
jgi:EAL domain-containing protein (putative c-di-GMP-specific phosphodiesterase class I)